MTTSLIPFAKAKERSHEGWKPFSSSSPHLLFGGAFSLRREQDESSKEGQQLILSKAEGDKQKKGIPFWKKKGTVLPFKAGRMTRKNISCDPYEPDVGILSSCGPGSYCKPSEVSRAGGFCVDHHHDEDGTTTTNTLLHRDLQDGFLYEFCNNQTATETYNCDCSGFSNNVGQFTCQIYEDTCFNVTSGSVCGDIAYEGMVGADGSKSFTVCYEIHSPFKIDYCLQYTYESGSDKATGCEMTIGCIKCNSCSIGTCGQVNSSGIAEFDCSNTVANTSGNSCDLGVYVFGFAYAESLPTHNITCSDDTGGSTGYGSMTSNAVSVMHQVSRILMLGSAFLAGGWTWN